MTKITNEELQTYNELQKKIRQRVNEISDILHREDEVLYPKGEWMSRYECESFNIIVKSYTDLGWGLGTDWETMEFPMEYLTMTNEEILENVRKDLVDSK
jgi:hypothetical protein